MSTQPLSDQEDQSAVIETGPLKKKNFKSGKKKKKNEDPPLVKLQVTNPITYLKKWWQKMIGNEGMELRFRVRPLTAIAISLVVVTVAFGLGNIVLPFKIPFFEYSEKPSPTSTPAVDEGYWKETGYNGKLRYSEPNDRYYLVTSSAEAITLDVPETVDLSELVGRKIFAVGQYNKKQRLLKVISASDLEVFPKSPIPIPTIFPTPTPSPTPSPSPSASSQPSGSPDLTTPSSPPN